MLHYNNKRKDYDQQNWTSKKIDKEKKESRKKMFYESPNKK